MCAGARHEPRPRSCHTDTSARSMRLRLAALERRVEVDELLASFGAPLQTVLNESDRSREERLLKLQMSAIEIVAWLDGSPICNRAFQAHTYNFM